MGTTVIGALVALVAMRLLWPEREQGHLQQLLGRAAGAAAEYLRAVVRFWAVGEQGRNEAERTVLAPARRAAGLLLLEAEETLDRLMLEPSFGRRNGGGEGRAEALTFLTYLRRLMRSATMLASVGVARGGWRFWRLGLRAWVLGWWVGSGLRRVRRGWWVQRRLRRVWGSSRCKGWSGRWGCWNGRVRG